MDSLSHTHTIKNEDLRDNKASQTEFTKEIFNKNDFPDWLKAEKDTVRWCKMNHTIVKKGPNNPRGRSAIYEWTGKNLYQFAGQIRGC